MVLVFTVNCFLQSLCCKQGSFKLSNIVEVDETYIGGKEKNKHANKKLNSGRGAVDSLAL
jgi:hypothetical protein